MTKKKLDLSKSLTTINGEQVRLLCSDRKSTKEPIVVLVNVLGIEYVITCDEYGFSECRNTNFKIINKIEHKYTYTPVSSSRASVYKSFSDKDIMLQSIYALPSTTRIIKNTFEDDVLVDCKILTIVEFINDEY